MGREGGIGRSEIESEETRDQVLTKQNHGPEGQDVI